jgi:bla regulator protein BlaR1
MMGALIWKATAVLLVALVVVRLAASARASIRHAVLLAALGIVAVLPLAMLSLPAVNIAVLPAAWVGAPIDEVNTPNEPVSAPVRPSVETAPVSVSPNAAPSTPALTTGSIVSVMWVTGSAAILLSLLVGVIRVQRLRRHALPYLPAQPLVSSLSSQVGVRVPIEVGVHEALSAPITCGVLRPSIVLPMDAQDWSERAFSRALVHELEHVTRRDWATQVAARAVCAVYWFHPLVWMVYRQLCLEAEHACDDAVVTREENTMYADQLVELARRMAAQPAGAMLGMAHRSDLSRRVAAVLDATKARGRAGTAHAATIALSAAALLLALAPLNLAAAPGAPSARSARSARSATSAPSAPDNPFLSRAIVEAADEGDIAAVRQLLDSGANVNAVVSGDGSPLIAAARGGYLELVQLLLDRGADINLVVEGDGSPLIMAAREGHLQIASLLLDRGAEIDRMAPGDENALIQASGEGHLEMVQLLVSRGADVNARSWAEQPYSRGRGEWRTPLSVAQREGHRDVVAFLRDRGASQ